MNVKSLFLEVGLFQELSLDLAEPKLSFQGSNFYK